MAVTDPLSHIDISVGYPDRSMPFYHAFLTALGFRRWKIDAPEWSGDAPPTVILEAGGPVDSTVWEQVMVYLSGLHPHLRLRPGQPWQQRLRAQTAYLY